jgi:Flp pilus assembly protein TadG
MKSIRLVRALADCRGVAAVEFAFIAPVMILVAFGVIELADVYSCYSKVQAMAATAADITSQDDEFSDSDRDNVFAASKTVLYPYNPSNAVIVISSVVDDGKGVTKVEWSDATDGNAIPYKTVVSLPPGIIASGGSVIMATITYSYTPPAISDFVGSMTFKEIVYAVPRGAAQVARIRG